MTTKSKDRRDDRKPRVIAAVGANLAGPVLDLLELTELAWHNLVGEEVLPDDIIDDILAVSEGNLATMMMAARHALLDRKDLKVWAEDASLQGDGARFRRFVQGHGASHKAG
ncbi:hypothetical protein LZC95_08370 [Pendulispora brunnea]|uniref:Uncharacterized protein n=1 Tax=Pendulispora brunnea TaxID=2905690 RepID=A0ABZ2KH02_9BACT